MKGSVINSCEKKEYVLGWLPIAFNLADHYNLIDMFMVEDISFPGYSLSFPEKGINCKFRSEIENK
jgi:hypothetical protein